MCRNPEMETVIAYRERGSEAGSTELKPFPIHCTGLALGISAQRRTCSLANCRTASVVSDARGAALQPKHNSAWRRALALRLECIRKFLHRVPTRSGIRVRVECGCQSGAY